MRHFFRMVKEVSKEYPNQAEDMLDLYSFEVFTWWGNWHEDTQDKILEEFVEFYDSMKLSYPNCIRRLI